MDINGDTTVSGGLCTGGASGGFPAKTAVGGEDSTVVKDGPAPRLAVRDSSPWTRAEWGSKFAVGGRDSDGGGSPEGPDVGAQPAADNVVIWDWPSPLGEAAVDPFPHEGAEIGELEAVSVVRTDSLWNKTDADAANTVGETHALLGAEDVYGV